MSVPIVSKIFGNQDLGDNIVLAAMIDSECKSNHQALSSVGVHQAKSLSRGKLNQTAFKAHDSHNGLKGLADEIVA